MAQAASRPSGALEAEVIACLAASDDPLTPSDVREQLGDTLAYTTVMTTLTRLFAKQAVTRELRGRAYAYRLAGNADGARASMTAHQMQKLLAGESNRATVLSRFVDGLDDDSEQILRDLLAGHSEPPAAAKPKRTRKRGKS